MGVVIIKIEGRGNSITPHLRNHMDFNQAQDVMMQAFRLSYATYKSARPKIQELMSEFSRHFDGTVSIKPRKNKLFIGNRVYNLVDGLELMLAEVKKNNPNKYVEIINR